MKGHLITFGLVSLLLLIAMGICTLLTFGFLMLSFEDYHFTWLIYAAGVLNPIVYAVLGYFSHRVAQFRLSATKHKLISLTVWLLLFGIGALIRYDGDALYNLPFWVTARTYFFPLYPKFATRFSMTVLEPLALALAHVLMFAAMALGMYVAARRRRERNE